MQNVITNKIQENAGSQMPVVERQADTLTVYPHQAVSISYEYAKLGIVSGAVWITLDRRDIFLYTGDELVIENAEFPAVISSLNRQPAVIEIHVRAESLMPSTLRA